MADNSKIRLYRMTHIDNVPHIIQYGITRRNSTNANTAYVPIGDVSLIDVRSSMCQTIHGNNVIIGDCIPFYFGTRMPMLYVIQHGYNWVPKPVNPSDIVYIVVSLESLKQDIKTFYFTDGHPTNSMTRFFDDSDIDKILDYVDMNAVRSKYWSDVDGVSDIKRRMQAEFLSPVDVAPQHILGYGCYDESAKNKLLSFGISENNIIINPNCYY